MVAPARSLFGAFRTADALRLPLALALSCERFRTTDRDQDRRSGPRRQAKRRARRNSLRSARFSGDALPWCQAPGRHRFGCVEARFGGRRDVCRDAGRTAVAGRIGGGFGRAPWPPARRTGNSGGSGLVATAASTAGAKTSTSPATANPRGQFGQRVHCKLFTHTSLLVSSTSASRCSSIWVTRSTSSMVVCAGSDLVPAVGAQRAHADLDGLLGDGRGRRAVQNQRAQRFVQDQQFVDAHAALVAQLPAFLAPGAVPELRRLDFVRRETDPAQVIRARPSAPSCSAGRWCGPGAGP